MPSGFLTLIVSLVVIYTLTRTSGNFVYTQDEQTSDHRRVRSICLLRCAKQAKVIFKECVQSCQRELNIDETLDFSKTVIEKPLILSRRNVDTMYSGVVNECATSPHYPKALKADGLSVDFTTKNTQVEVTWNAIDQSNTDFNWTAYAVIYQIHKKTKASCIVVPKNQTHYMVPDKHWTHPNSFYVAVVTHPYNENSVVELKSFDPTVTKTTFTPTVKKTDTAKLVTSIVVGLTAGLLLLLLLCFAIKWRKKRQCPDPRLYANPPPAPMRPDNSKEMYYTCYYPEGEKFRERVASIVNYFRQNGYNVIMDVMVSGEITSQGPTRWAESQMRKARKVLVFLSPGLVNLALDGRDNSQSQDINRVWIELEVLRDIYTRNRSASKMVCLALPDTPVSSSELPLWAKVSYKWPADAQEILKRLNDRPMILPLSKTT